MSGNFWRGLVAGSLLAAVMTMLKKPQRKPAELRETALMRRMQPRRTAKRMLREVSRTMDGWVRKRR